MNDGKEAGPNTESQTFGFVDLAGFTALTEAHGDADALILLERFVELTENAVAGYGTVVKTIGDAVMLRFSSPTPALQAMSRLIADVGAEQGFPVLRAGLHHGPAIARGPDFFGATVNLAARITGEAHGSQLLATAIVAIAADELGMEAIDLGEFRLRNLIDAVRLFEIVLVPSEVPNATDPVCRMRVEHRYAVGRIRHAGDDYWFCSLKCVAAFAAAPGKYV